uniref:Vacuole membrane protein 1 n=1 Tax=Piliocolobus tephrosceles TaxID=591936 RepID=A0A8C9GVW4_9PRIM
MNPKHIDHSFVHVNLLILSFVDLFFFFLKCITRDDGNTTLTRLFLKIYPYCVIWGIGTALGELPPYLTSYYASKTKLCDDDYEEFEKDIKEGRRDIITYMKIWMIDFIKKHGSISVFLLSSWPNVMFDLCGICCGHFLMPFQNFFVPLILGKAFVKTFFQAFFLIFIFSNNYKEAQFRMLRKVFLYLPLHKISSSFDPAAIENYIDEKISFLKYGQKTKHKMNYMFLFNVFFFVVIILFFISCINQIAQKYQKVTNGKKKKKINKNNNNNIFVLVRSLVNELICECIYLSLVQCTINR